MNCVSTTKLLLIFAAAGIAGSPPISTLTAAQRSPYTSKDIPPPAKKTARVQITEGPALELFRNNEAIIRWTSDNPGGSDEHFGVVQYGTDPHHLDLTAKSHIRLNRNHRYTIFRVRVEGLQPGATYYYTVHSLEADGRDDGMKSGVYHLTTPRID
ncbi:MAG TPA: fibronectin type III domain-containing protein [Bryobacteraceae bacterium]|jgi:phosphodiesterase/alkaline phosphatase D-like protein|nr:fibronectin type III domain-containing protein [Bryobacteraceae bacterium]